MPRGRIGHRFAPTSESSSKTEPCRVSAQLDEDGTLIVSVSASGEYIQGARVAAHIDTDEIPDDLKEKVRAVLQEVLDDAHDDLKDEFNRERTLMFMLRPETRIDLGGKD